MVDNKEEVPLRARRLDTYTKPFRENAFWTYQDSCTKVRSGWGVVGNSTDELAGSTSFSGVDNG